MTLNKRFIFVALALSALLGLFVLDYAGYFFDPREVKDFAVEEIPVTGEITSDHSHPARDCFSEARSILFAHSKGTLLGSSVAHGRIAGVSLSSAVRISVFPNLVEYYWPFASGPNSKYLVVRIALPQRKVAMIEKGTFSTD